MSGEEQARQLARILAQRPRAVRPEWDAVQSAVLVPLYWDRGEWYALYTRRTETVESHRGQVSFPGGRIDAHDRNAIEAALREAEEEVGVHATDVRVLGLLNTLLTVTQFEITPVVAQIPWPYPLRLNPHEVACAFGVPLRWLADAANLEMHPRQPPLSGKEILVYSFKPFLGETIWGATARITIDLLARWQELQGKETEQG